MNKLDRTHFSDGYIYDKFITPQMTKTNRLISKFIDDNSNVLEVGCGIGSLSLMLAGKCGRITGIDFSSKMINYAERRKNKIGADNINFIHGDASTMSGLIKDKFDTATLIMFLHETEEDITKKVVSETLKLSPKLIISDFISPLPENFNGKFLRFQEFMAGKRHYHNFKDWQKNGGIDYIIKSCGLHIVKEIMWKGNAGKIVIATK
ncbi:MAG: class I SAM-dependent methyltransferase [Methanomicrobiales archaeon]